MPAVNPSSQNPQHVRRHVSREHVRFGLGWAVALGAAALVVAGATLPPFVGEPLRAALMMLFDPLCHQLPERSPHVAGVPLAACHRCYGIYVGVLAGAAAFPLLRRWRPLRRHVAARGGRVLMAAGVPTAIDWAGDVAGLWANTPVSRMSTGALFGLVAGYVFARAVVQAVRPQHVRSTHVPAASDESKTPGAAKSGETVSV